MRIVKPNNPAVPGDTGQDENIETETASDSQNIDITAAALDAFCRAPSQTYEQFMQTFTYLTPADVQIPSSLAFNDGSGLGATGGDMGIPAEGDFHGILAGIARERAEILQTLSMEEPVERIQQEPVAIDTKTSHGDELEEEMLGEGLCTSHLTDVSRSDGTFVKFDNFVDDEGSDEEADKDPDADVDDSDVVSSSSYMASFAAGAESCRGQNWSGHRNDAGKVKDNDQEAQSRPAPNTNKHKKNLCNQHTKTNSAEKQETESCNPGIQVPAVELSERSCGVNIPSSSLEENRSTEALTDQVATCLIRNQIDRQSLSEQESILDIVKSSESDDDMFNDTEPSNLNPDCDTIDSTVLISDTGSLNTDITTESQCPSHSTHSQATDIVVISDNNSQQTCRSSDSSELELINEISGSPHQIADDQTVSQDSSIAANRCEEKVTDILNSDQYRSSSNGVVTKTGSLLDLVVHEDKDADLVYDPDMDGPNPGEVDDDEVVQAAASLHNNRRLEFSARFKSVEDMIEESKVTVATEPSENCDDVTPFSLDEDFDYDNVKLTPKFTPEEMVYLKCFVPSTQQSADQNT